MPATSLGSIRQTAVEGARQAARAFESEAARVAGGQVDVRSMMEANQQVTLYSINLKMIAMTDEMVGQVLDILA